MCVWEGGGVQFKIFMAIEKCGAPAVSFIIEKKYGSKQNLGSSRTYHVIVPQTSL